MTSCDDLIRRIEDALLVNDGDELEVAWYSLFEQHPSKAVRIAQIMKPLAKPQEVLT